MLHEVLVVDSRPAVLYSIVEALQSAGYSTAGATTFEEAGGRLKAHPPRLLLTGIRLGAFNGLHLVIRARFDHPNTASIILSDAADAVLEAEAGRHGATWLVRPVGQRALASAVARVLGAADQARLALGGFAEAASSHA